jgi:branched-chain amino acid transport system permease protein
MQTPDSNASQSIGSIPLENRSLKYSAVAVLLFSIASLLLMAPFYLEPYWLRVLSLMFMYASLAQGINLIAGFAGYPAFGNVVFFGLGAYSVAIVMVKGGGSFLIGLLVALALCMVSALLIGPALLRLRGHYFAIATVGLNETVKAVVNNLTFLTGGGMGLSLPLPPWTPLESARIFYYMLFGTMAIGILLAAWFRFSRLGYAARAIRDDEVKAEAMGLRTTTIKAIAWTVSAGLTGTVGAIYAYWFSYVEPSAVFDMVIAIKAFVMFMLGGAATVFGPVFGAFVVEYASTMLWSHVLEYHIGALGLGIILIALYMPRGLVLFARQGAQRALALFEH